MLTDYTFYRLWLIQIISESLPISSSGHIKLIKQYLNKPIVFSKTIEYFMHTPTLLVLFLFLIKFLLFISWSALLYLGLLVFIADTATLLFYFLFKLIDISKFPLALGFFITTGLIFFLSMTGIAGAINNIEKISLFHACLIGIAQGISLLPGISRLASTIVMACCLGLLPEIALIFSCAIQFPLVFVAVIKSFHDIYIKHKILHCSYNLYILIGLIISTFIAYILLWLVLYMLNNNFFILFGWYMLIPTILAILALINRNL